LDELYHFTVAWTWVANGRGVRGNPKDIWWLDQHGVGIGYVVHLSRTRNTMPDGYDLMEQQATTPLWRAIPAGWAA
jgi:hypothetical protein